MSAIKVWLAEYITFNVWLLSSHWLQVRSQASYLYVMTHMSLMIEHQVKDKNLVCERSQSLIAETGSVRLAWLELRTEDSYGFVFLSSMSREQKAVDRARKAFETGRSKPLEYRIEQLKNLQRLFTERQREIADAIKKDLNKVKWPLLPAHPDSRKLEKCLSKMVPMTIVHTHAECKHIRW